MFRSSTSKKQCVRSCERDELLKIGVHPNYVQILEAERQISSKCEEQCSTYENSRAFVSCKEKQTRKCGIVKTRFSQRTYECEKEAEEFCQESEGYRFLWKLFG
nr:hypothetical protein MarFTME_131 [Marseillevirus futianmevirus]